MKKTTKTGLSIGAGIEQLAGIKKAKFLGHRVIAIDMNEASIGFQDADEKIILSIHQQDRVAEIAKKYKIDYIIPVPIGRWLTTTGFINSKLNLKGISYSAALLCANKEAFNKKLKNHISLAQQFPFDSISDLLKDKKTISWKNPYVIKPKFGSGSRGIKVVYSLEDAINFINESPNIFKDGILLESFLAGKNYGLDGVIIDHKFHLILLREKTVTPLPYRVETGYLARFDYHAEVLKAVQDTIQRCVEVMGLNNCLVHADLIINEHQVNIIEISGRPSGLFISSKLVKIATSLDFIQEGIKLVAGEEYSFNLQNKTPSFLGYFSFNKTIEFLKKLPSEKDLAAIEGLISYQCNLQVGQFVPVCKNIGDFIHRGHFVIQGENKNDLLKNINNLYSLFE